LKFPEGEVGIFGRKVVGGIKFARPLALGIGWYNGIKEEGGGTKVVNLL